MKADTRHLNAKVAKNSEETVLEGGGGGGGCEVFGGFCQGKRSINFLRII